VKEKKLKQNLQAEEKDTVRYWIDNNSNEEREKRELYLEK
jgi:hypothetical protein